MLNGSVEWYTFWSFIKCEIREENVDNFVNVKLNAWILTLHWLTNGSTDNMSILERFRIRKWKLLNGLLEYWFFQFFSIVKQRKVEKKLRIISVIAWILIIHSLTIASMKHMKHKAMLESGNKLSIMDNHKCKDSVLMSNKYLENWSPETDIQSMVEENQWKRNENKLLWFKENETWMSNECLK